MRPDTVPRMLDLLWWVGYCGDFPVCLAKRINGHEEWNRHVMYETIRKGYLEVYRAGKKRQRVIRSLRITESGLDYVGERDADRYNLILARQALLAREHMNPNKLQRSHAIAHGLIMANAVGAVILPSEKPSLLSKGYGNHAAFDPNATYYYPSWELRAALQELESETLPKTSRVIGVLIREETLYFLYYTGLSRMYWRQSEELNVIAAIRTLLSARGFRSDLKSQVVIGHGFEPAKKIARQGINAKSRYLCITTDFNNCYYVTDDAAGDRLLRSIVDPEARKAANDHALNGYCFPKQSMRSYDALTPDTAQPVILCYPFDLNALLLLNKEPFGYPAQPVLLCYDYQVDAIQDIVGPAIEVRIIQGGQNETAK